MELGDHRAVHDISHVAAVVCILVHVWSFATHSHMSCSTVPCDHAFGSSLSTIRAAYHAPHGSTKGGAHTCLALLCVTRNEQAPLKVSLVPHASQMRVSGAFFAAGHSDPITAHVGPAHVAFAHDSNGLASSRPPARAAVDATRIRGEDAMPITAESLDNAIADVSECVPLHPDLDSAADAAPDSRQSMPTLHAGLRLEGAVDADMDGESDADEDTPLSTSAPLFGREVGREVGKRGRRAHKPKLSWSSDWEALRRIFFAPPLPPGSLPGRRGGFGRDDLRGRF